MEARDLGGDVVDVVLHSYTPHFCQCLSFMSSGAEGDLTSLPTLVLVTVLLPKMFPSGSL